MEEKPWIRGHLDTRIRERLARPLREGSRKCARREDRRDHPSLAAEAELAWSIG
jgi:hypothetical protein